MMWTTSLRRRIVAAVLVASFAAALAVGVVTYRDMSAQLEADLVSLLEARRSTAGEVLVRNGGDLAATARDLAEIGLPARVLTDDGRDLSVQPEPSPLTGKVADVRDEDAAASVILTGSGSVEVLASRESADRILARLGLLLAVGLLVVPALVVALVSRAVGVALRPLEQMRTATARITGGAWGERMRPSDPGTEIGALADDLDTMLDAFEAAAVAARTAEQSQRRLLADVAHQLRTPMAGVRVSTELLLLRGDRTPEERERLLGNLIRETTRASRMVNGLLRISRFDLGEGLMLEPNDLVDMCRQEVERQAALAEVPVTLEVIQAPATPVLVDTNQFLEVLANLLDNARRFAHSRIVVTVNELDDGQSVVRVQDDGPGLAPEDRERAFERFVTYDSGVGTGLGLSIARGIVRAHGGELSFTDGAFEIRLPGAVG